jgi:hypothetical protein
MTQEPLSEEEERRIIVDRYCKGREKVRVILVLWLTGNLTGYILMMNSSLARSTNGKIQNMNCIILLIAMDSSTRNGCPTG